MAGTGDAHAITQSRITSPTETNRAIETAFGIERVQLIAGLVRVFRDVGVRRSWSRRRW